MHSAFSGKEGHQVLITSALDLGEFWEHQFWPRFLAYLFYLHRNNFYLIPNELLVIETERVNEMALSIFVCLLSLNHYEITSKFLSASRNELDIR